MFSGRLRGMPGDFLRALRRWHQDDGRLMAAATAFYAILSLFPLLLILTAILGVILRFSSGAQDAQSQLLLFITDASSPEVARYIERLMANIQTNAVVGGPIGVLMLVYGAVRVFAQVDGGFHRIWRTRPRRRRWFSPVLRVVMRRLRAGLLLLGLGLLVIATYLSQPLLGVVSAYLGAASYAGGAVYLANVIAMGLLNAASLTLVYRILPKTPVRWRDAAGGAVLTTLLWNVARVGLTLLPRGSRYTAYGLFGSVIIIMMWFYIASGIFYLGAEYCALLGEEGGDARRDRPASDRPP